MGVQARTLEYYRMAGLAQDAISLGVRTGDAHVWVEGHERASFSLRSMGDGLSAFPFLLTLAQDVHEQFLLEQLAKMDIVPEWNTELVDLKQTRDHVAARLARADGSEEHVSVPWLVGCDGARSIVRERLNIGFSGGTSEGLFFVADVKLAKPNLDVHVGIGPETLSLMMPVRTSGTQRLIGIVPSNAARGGEVEFSDVAPRAAELLSIDITEVNWFSTYKVHHRVAERFRVGRCFIAGDAGHIHSPVGGQGMNTGLGDAMNLGWKLGHVIAGLAGQQILDTCEPERIAFAKSLIASTDTAFQKMVATGRTARLLRLHLVPWLVGLLTKFKGTGQKIFENVSQIRIKYPDSDLSEGAAGKIKAGDRLPWSAAQDMHSTLDGRTWSAHAIGAIDPSVRSALMKAGLTVHTWPDTRATRQAGFAAGAIYLVRPDGHVGFADPKPSSREVVEYLAKFGMRASRLSITRRVLS